MAEVSISPLFSSVVESKLFLSVPTPAPLARKSELRLRLQRRLWIVLNSTGTEYLKMSFFDLISRINVVAIYENFFRDHGFL
jgi:hypothetical protein